MNGKVDFKHIHELTAGGKRVELLYDGRQPGQNPLYGGRNGDGRIIVYDPVSFATVVVHPEDAGAVGYRILTEEERDNFKAERHALLAENRAKRHALKRSGKKPGIDTETTGE